MKKVQEIDVKSAVIRTMKVSNADYICITDIARQKNPLEPKDVVKNWMRLKNTIEHLGVWEMLNNPDFKGGEFDHLWRQAGSNAFTLNPMRWIEYLPFAFTEAINDALDQPREKPSTLRKRTGFKTEKQ